VPFLWAHDFGVGEGGFVHVLGNADGRFARHNLRDKFLLILY
jgi:hypothetical protein